MDLYLAERLAGLKDPGLVRATSNLAASDLLIHPVEPASFPGTGKAPPWMRPPEADRPEAVPDAGCKLPTVSRVPAQPNHCVQGTIPGGGTGCIEYPFS